MQRVRFRIDLGPNCSIGPGKIELLETIGETGSIRKAAAQLGMKISCPSRPTLRRRHGVHCASAPANQLSRKSSRGRWL
jgi:hypothetical protein